MTRILGALLLAFAVAAARGQGLDWEIDSYDVEIVVHDDASLDVTERIVADFTRDPHRGIVREIPFRHRRQGSDFAMRLELVSITDGQGQEHPHVSERRGDRLWIRIGRANVSHASRQTYVVHYRVRRGLLSFDSHDELYWNATGTEWPVPIEAATCVVTLPGTISSGSIRAQSFVGRHGGSGQGPAPTIDGQTIRFDAGRRLWPTEGMTIVVGWPPGAIAHPTWTIRAQWFIADNWIVVVPLITAPMLLGLWRLLGRDRGRPAPIVVQYDAPDDLSPIEVGALVDERLQTSDVVASVIGLAVRGYVRIDASSKDDDDVHIIKTRAPDDALSPVQRMVYDAVLRGKDESRLADLKHKFYLLLPGIRKNAYKSLRKRGLINADPHHIIGLWVALGVAWAVGVPILAVALGTLGVFAPAPLIIAAVFTAPQLLIISPFMPRRTEKGRRALERIRGLEEYIRRAELPRIDARLRQAEFEDLLPYAMALGLAKEWAAKFDGMFTPDPSWYVGSTNATTTGALVSMLSRTGGSIGNTIVSVPRSESSGSPGGGGWSSGGFGGGRSGFSGGFSGGGGGGGGGRGW